MAGVVKVGNLEWLWERVDVSATAAAQAVSGTAIPLVLGKIRVETALSAHALPINDGTSTNVCLTLAASASAGTIVDMSGTRFETSMLVDAATSTATGVILIQYREQ